MTATINNIILFAKKLIGIPYKWWVKGETSNEKEPFWASNTPVPKIENITSVNCTGFINLMRRFNGLSVPGVNIHKYAGGTYIWYNYLNRKKYLKRFNINELYPKGTLLIRKYRNDKDQGHVAVIITANKQNVLYENIIHSYSPDGVGISKLGYSHFSIENGYYEYICLPQHWLLTDQY